MSDSESRCHRCGYEISVEEQYILNGVTVCDDCYLEVTNSVKAVNPLVVYPAKRFQEKRGCG